MKNPSKLYRELLVTSYDLTAYFMQEVGLQEITRYQLLIKCGKIQPIYDAFQGWLDGKFGHHVEFSTTFLNLPLIFSDDSAIYYSEEDKDVYLFAELFNNTTKQKINKWKQL